MGKIEENIKANKGPSCSLPSFPSPDYNKKVFSLSLFLLLSFPLLVPFLFVSTTAPVFVTRERKGHSREGRQIEWQARDSPSFNERKNVFNTGDPGPKSANATAKWGTTVIVERNERRGGGK